MSQDVAELKFIERAGRVSTTTDTLLLADFVELKPGKKAVELGTGTGVIPIILVCRVKAEVFGIDSESQPLRIAQENLKLNQARLKGKVNFTQANIKGLEKLLGSAKFDVVLSNPPYYVLGSGKVPPDAARRKARFEAKVTLQDIMATARNLLKNKGRFYIIHKPDRLVEIVSLARDNSLEPKLLQPVYTKQGKTAEFIMIKMIKGAKPGLSLLPPHYR